MTRVVVSLVVAGIVAGAPTVLWAQEELVAMTDAERASLHELQASVGAAPSDELEKETFRRLIKHPDPTLKEKLHDFLGNHPRYGKIWYKFTPEEINTLNLSDKEFQLLSRLRPEVADNYAKHHDRPWRRQAAAEKHEHLHERLRNADMPADQKKQIHDRLHNAYDEHHDELPEADRPDDPLAQRLHNAVENGDLTSQQARRIWNAKHDQPAEPTDVRRPRERIDDVLDRPDRRVDRRTDRRADHQTDRRVDRRIDRQADRRVDRRPLDGRVRDLERATRSDGGGAVRGLRSLGDDQIRSIGGGRGGGVRAGGGRER